MIASKTRTALSLADADARLNAAWLLADKTARHATYMRQAILDQRTQLNINGETNAVLSLAHLNAITDLLAEIRAMLTTASDKALGF